MNDLPPPGSTDSDVTAPPAPSPSSPTLPASSVPDSSVPDSSVPLAPASAADGGEHAPAGTGAAVAQGSVAAARAQTQRASSNEAMPTIAGIGVLLVNL